MDRVYFELTKQHLDEFEQMIFIEGPRQVGKTTVAKQLAAERSISRYMNWDNKDDQMEIIQGPKHVASYLPFQKISEQKSLLLLDEIQKYPDWKNYIKGFYDTYKQQIQLLITGSAKLTIYKRGGDSLMGRYFVYRMHPFSVAEIVSQKVFISAAPKQELQNPKEIPREVLESLIALGGFPAPFINGSKAFYNRWTKLRFEQLIKEDVQSFIHIHSIVKLELLARILESQIGNLTNFSALGVKVGVGSDTVKSWIDVLQNNYYCFSIQPWTKNIARSLLKNPKIYLWDWSLVKNKGCKYENFIASHLLKAVHFWEDSGYGEYGLHFLRDKDKREVDFLVTKNEEPWFLVEVKSSGKASLSKSLYYYQQVTGAKHAFQVVFDLPYVERNCFDYFEPIIVPVQTLLSQLV